MEKESKIGAGEVTPSQVGLANTIKWIRLVGRAPKGAQVVVRLWTNLNGCLKPPSKLNWTKAKLPVNISHQISPNGNRWISKVLHTKLKQLKTPGMNDTRKVSSQGKTDPKSLERSVGRCKPPLYASCTERGGSGEPWFQHQLSLLLAMDSQAH